MPLYEVTHSYPLTHHQKCDLAAQITKIHSTSFLTPSVFVHVQFHSQDATEGNYFIAGKIQHNSANRIQGMLRTSETRKKEDFDRVTGLIEKAWYDVVSPPAKEGPDGKKKEESTKDKEAKKLRFITVYPMVTARELGSVIPTAGQEKAWFHEYKSQFQKEADSGNQELADMLKEVEEREDLKKVWL